MKRFPHLVSKLFYEPISITATKHALICRVIDAHMAGPHAGFFDDEDQAKGDETHGYQEFGSTAIIPIHGVIGKHLSSMESMSGDCCDLDHVSTQIDVAMGDNSITRLLFDFRSPGGTVTGIPEIARKIAAITEKETVAFTDSECCSAALWLASQCQAFYATESATIGSIGVWCAYTDASRQMANEGVSIQAISAGKYKLLGAYWRALTDEEKQMLQTSVDKLHAQFKQAVNLRRSVDEVHMEGQTFDGEEAVHIGLTDGAVDDMSELVV